LWRVRNPKTAALISHAADKVTRAVYDLLGREVDRLFDDVGMPAGRHEALWQPAPRAGGVYLYKLIADDAVKAGRMVLIR